MTNKALLAVVVLVGIAAPLEAQIVDRPPRSTDPPRSTEGLFGGGTTANPNVTRSELMLSLDALGGWDDNLTPEGGGVSTNPFGARQSGYAGIGSASLRYWRGRAARAFETTGRAYVNTYSDLGIAALVGGELNVQGQTQMGRRNHLTAIAEGRYQPTLTLTAFGPVADQVDAGVIAGQDPTRGVTDMRSASGGGTLELRHDWTRRQYTTVHGEYAKHQFVDGPALGSEHYVTGLRHNWDFARNAAANVQYRYMDQQMDDPGGGTRPLESHALETGLELRRTLSRTRRVVFGGGAGATRVRSTTAADHTPFEYVAPSGYGSARLDIGQTWAISGDFRRAPNVLEGLTNETFFTNAASLSVGGAISRRVGFTVSGAYSHGEAHGTDRGAFTSFTGIAQVLYAVSDCCSMVTSYGYYEHRLQDMTAILPGYPFRFERNSIRVGMSVRLPLYGSFESTGAAGGR